MKKKPYLRPTAHVVLLQVTHQLLAGSGQAGVQDYTDHTYYEE